MYIYIYLSLSIYIYLGNIYIYTGWWFGTWILWLPYIGNVIILTDEVIFPHIFVWGSCFWLCTSALPARLPRPARRSQLVHTQLAHTQLVHTHNLSHTQLVHTQLVTTQLIHTKADLFGENLEELAGETCCPNRFDLLCTISLGNFHSMTIDFHSVDFHSAYSPATSFEWCASNASR